jgi:nitrogen regulatory protein PII
MTACEVRSDGATGRPVLYRGSRYAMTRPKIRLEIVVDDDFADAVVRRLVVTANRDRRAMARSRCSRCSTRSGSAPGSADPDAL